MPKRGPKPKGKVRIEWSPEFAYAIGLITTDGNLSPDKRHVHFTSKDQELVESFRSCLGIKNEIGKKARGYDDEKKYFVIQFGDVLFYSFLLTIGLMPNKSKTLGKIKIPGKYFFDFLRGHFDGDGCFYSYWDPRWRSSFMFYMTFLSASKSHVLWMQREIKKSLKISGHITTTGVGPMYSLKYAKAESLVLINGLYKNDGPRLSRKYLKIKDALCIIGKSNFI